MYQNVKVCQQIFRDFKSEVGRFNRLIKLYLKKKKDIGFDLGKSQAPTVTFARRRGRRGVGVALGFALGTLGSFVTFVVLPCPLACTCGGWWSVGGEW